MTTSKSPRSSLQAHIYFIFKINEHLKNAYHALQNNRCDSLQSILQECIIIQDEINKNLGDEVKLTKGLKSQFNSLIFWYKENPLYKHKALNRSMGLLIEKINSDQDKVELYNSMSSFLKTVKRLNLVSLHIDVLSGTKAISFREVDIILDSLISELVFEGYSLKYLREWYSLNIFKSSEIKDLSESNVIKLLEEIKKITKKKDVYNIIFNCWLPEEFITEGISTITPNEWSQFYVVDHSKLNIEGINQIFSFQQGLGALKIKVNALDKYKAIELAKGYVEGYLEVYKQLHNKPNLKIIVGNFSFISLDENEWQKERIDMEDIQISAIDEREKEDIRKFIKLRNMVNREKIVAPDILILERALFLINKSTELSLENKFLNLWSALEYLLASYHKGSIIGRVIDIVSKVLILYFIKDKMNVLWERLVKLKEYSKEPNLVKELEKLFVFCEDKARKGKYIKESFAQYLAGKDSISLYGLLERNIVAQREMADLHDLFTRKEKLKESLEYNRNSIVHDLARIYRVRNKLVHSGSHIPNNLDVYTGRLFRYINCLVGTLIYYSNKTPELSIGEILSSTVQTYSNYEQTILKDETNLGKVLKEVVTPPYLFL